MKEHRKVLHIEDNEDDQVLLQLACRKARLPLKLIPARDGEQAMAYLRGGEPFADRSKFPDPELILLDLKIPGCSGLEVLKWIRQQPSMQTIPVVVFSASEQESDRSTALALGASGCFAKPLDVNALVTTLRDIYQRWLE